jgi:hypothetical protein
MMWAMAEADGIADLDTSVAHPARVYDYWLGGKDNFAADRAASLLDFGQPVTVSHPAIDIHQSQANAQRVYNERVATPQTLRTREQVARFFAGLELVDPGLVQVHQWRPGPGDSAPEGTVSAHGAVARKPGA